MTPSWLYFIGVALPCDYGCACRNGLVGRYYRSRWAIFLQMVVNQSVVPGRPLPLPSHITSELDIFAQHFCHETDHASYATNATGGDRALELSHQLLDQFNDARGVTLTKYTKHVGKDHPQASADLNLGHAIVSDSRSYYTNTFTLVL